MCIINQIVNTNLFVGNSRSPLFCESNGIEVVINLANDLNDPLIHNVRLHKIGLHDGGNNLSFEYYEAASLSLRYLDIGKKVLIHCHEGRSRSAAIALLVISVLKNREQKTNDFEKLLFQAKDILFYSRPICSKMNEEHEHNIMKTLKEFFVI